MFFLSRFFLVCIFFISWFNIKAKGIEGGIHSVNYVTSPLSVLTTSSEGLKINSTIGEGITTLDNTSENIIRVGFNTQINIKKKQVAVLNTKKELKVFFGPIPAKETISVFFEANYLINSDFEFQIYSLDGIKLLSRKIYKNQLNKPVTISLESLPVGILFVRVLNESENSLIKSFNIIKY